ncbi:amino acid adenylation domain-containing protein [Pseudomonas sp. CDFA 602]|uniref:non-ribosomal peptide synthetase n=1 Tax=Pseudomonas californiensis TaxID=2829823 RepID=UPI001E4430FC|nr:non-ribosomal peptide synthetase [Pseudomonas californiensis]MCD5996930.1 amino acid adenylation domain-containing protein [Pseudomonas californiensis]MCD6002503.1 amino acid adenylation domain-containing protein [Pseudomonas californiensis]
MNDLSVDLTAQQTLALSPEQRASLLGHDPARADAGSHRLRIALSAADAPTAVHAALQQYAAGQPLLGARWLQVSGFRGWRQAFASQSVLVRWVELDATAPALTLDEGEVLAVNCRTLADGTREVEFVAAALALDPPSLERLVADVLALAQGETPVTRDVGYEHYVEWRQDMAADEDAAQGRAYWQHAQVDPAQGAALHLGLRSAVPLPQAQRLNVQAEVPASRLSAVQALADFLGQPLDFVLQGLWWALLSRLSGQQSFVGGWLHDCRNDYDHFEHTLGVFEKVLPLRVELDPACRFAEWLQQAEGVLSDHLGWQEYCPIEAPTSAAPLLAGFVSEQARIAPGRVLAYPDRSAFELLLRARRWGETLHLSIEANGAAYSVASLEVLLEQFQTLLETLPADGAIALADLEPTGAKERQRLLALAPNLPAPDGEGLLQRLARHARQTPQAMALSNGQQRLDYAELQHTVTRMAGWLQGQGVGVGQCVAIESERSLQGVLHILAVLSAGAYYLPLEPGWPAERRHDLLTRAAPALVLCDPASSSAQGPWPSASLEQAGADAPMPFQAPQLTDQHLAYLLFTSGSTGAPKGVLIEHGALRNYAQSACEALGLQPGMRLALTSPLTVDLGHTLLFGAWQAGAELVIAAQDDLVDGAAFSRFLFRERPDVAKFVPSHLAALLEGDAPPLPGTLILGGEATPRRLVEQLFAQAPALRLFNHYGPTETTVGVLYHPLRADAPDRDDRVPLSRVLDGNRVYLLDDRLRLVPTGALGELYIGGAQLCRGYLDEANAERFVDDPFMPGQRLYRSGDLGRYRAEGGLQLVGRQDHQVKLRGQRIELGEVEAALLGLPGVDQAVARLWSPSEGAASLIAYVVLAQGVADDALQQLPAALAERLPEALCPARLLAVPSLPRLSNGKVDRHALPEPGQLARRQPARAPTSELEASLRDAMAELLDCAPTALGVDDDFFEAGGHSLLVIKLVARLRTTFKLEVPPGLVFDHPNAAGLAVALGELADPARLEKIARLRRELDSLSDEERAALLAKARAAKGLAAH